MTLACKSRILHWRRYLRFSLRSLLVSILLIGGGLGWFIRSAENQRAFYLAIEKSGGWALYQDEDAILKAVPRPSSMWPHWLANHLPFDYCHNITSVGVGSVGLSDEDFSRIGDLTQLKELYFEGTRPMTLGDANLSVRCLLVAGPSFGDAEVQNLSPLPHAKILSRRITDTGLAHVKGLTGLRNLDLTECYITDAGMLHLKALTGIQGLSLESCHVTDAGLANLEGMTKLRYLILYGTQTTDAGLLHLRKLTNLQLLCLAHTRVTDQGLKKLQGIKSLKVVWLRATQVTDEGVKELRNAMPDLTIHP